MLRHFRSVRLTDEAVIGLLLLFGAIAAGVNATVSEWFWAVRIAVTLAIFGAVNGLVYVAWQWYRQRRQRGQG